MQTFSDNLYWIALGVVIVLMLVASYAFGKASQQRQSSVEIHSRKLIGQKKTYARWWADWLQGLSTEMIGASISTILLVVIVGAVQQQQLIDDERNRLILQLGSPNHDFAIEASRILRLRGWLTDGSLRNIDLQGFNLSNADLSNADLQYATLEGIDFGNSNLDNANLSFTQLRYSSFQDTSMDFANLEGAILIWANLDNAKLYQANLRNAILSESTLYNAYLSETNFEGANLNLAVLNGANLEGSNITLQQLLLVASLRNAILPDGTKYDGRYNIRHEIGAAERSGLDTTDPIAMANWYGVSLQEYLRGQEWAKKNLP